MTNPTYINDRLVEWGDQVFEPPLRKARPKKDQHTSLWLSAYHAWKGVEPGHRGTLIREQIERTITKAPEVMVKITSKKNAGKGMKAIANHLSYISRNGKLELETDQGELIIGKGALKDLFSDWQTDATGSVIPEESHERLATNLMFSMPKGTPSKELHDCVRSVLHEELQGRYAFVFALHEDTDHVHAHVCVKRAALKRGPLFALKKADLARWRERFASHLRDHGIEANATPRRTRGVTKESLPLEIYHLAQAGRQKQLQKRPIAVATEGLFEKQRAAWSSIGATLKASSTNNDQILASDIELFIKETFENLSIHPGQSKTIPQRGVNPKR
jgi:hypothetical protein